MAVIVIDTFQDNLMISDFGLATTPLPTEAGSQAYPFTLRPVWPAVLDGATITDAVFGFPCSTGAGSSSAVSVKRLLRAWVEGEATPTNWSSGNAWTTLNAAGDGTDRVATDSATGTYPGSFFTGVTDATGAGLVADLNGMAAATLAKDGWLVTAGFSVGMPGNATPALRPTLTVTYTAAGGADLAAAATGGGTATGALDVAATLPSYGAASAAGTLTNTTTHTVAYPAGIVAGSLLRLVVTGRSNTAGTHPAITGGGWTEIGFFEGGSGAAFAADAGNRFVSVWKKDTVTGSESGSITVTLAGTTANTLYGSMHRIEMPAGYTLVEDFVSGADTTAGTGFSAAASAALALAPGDLLLVAVASSTDTATQSAQAITAAGITFDTRTNRASAAVTGGNDHRHIVDSVSVASGSATVAPTYAYTASASTSGPAGFLRVRAVAPGAAVTLAGAAAGAGTASGDLAHGVPLAGGATGGGTASGGITHGVPLAGAATGGSAAAGDVAHGVPLAGAATGGGAASATLTAGSGLAGNATGAGQATGLLASGRVVNTGRRGSSRNRPGRGPYSSGRYYIAQRRPFLLGAQVHQLAGAAAMQSSAAAALALLVQMQAAAAGGGTASGSLGSSSVVLGGAALGQGSASGAMSHAVPLGGAAVAVGVASGQMAISVALGGAALGSAVASGSFNGVISLAGGANGLGTAGGTLLLSVPLGGAAQALAQASGALVMTVRLGGAAGGAGAAAGALSVAGPATVFLASAAGGTGMTTGALFVLPITGTSDTAWRVHAEPRNWRVRGAVRNWRIRSLRNPGGSC